MQVQVKTFLELTTVEMYEILRARFTVFVMEQRCFYLDPDGIDYEALHLFIEEEGRVIAYARMFPNQLAFAFVPLPQEPNAWHIGRLLTINRGIGLSKLLMEKILQIAKERQISVLRMEAQHHAIGLYEKYGFRVISDPFDEAGVMHVEMEKRF